MSRSARAAASECLTDEALSHLKTYRYSSVDLSPLSKYVLQHYWNGVVKLLPLWLAPNMVTLIGFFFVLGNLVLLEIYVPDLVGPAPSWVYYSFGFGLWMYSTMDNVDGKQARRTGTSSGLGELFDHGIDSLNCTLGSLFQTAALAFGSTKIGAFTALLPTLLMFFSTWETYHTHTLYLGYFNGPTEGLVIGCIMMVVSGYCGPAIWATPLLRPFPFLSPILSKTTTLRDLWVPLLLGGFLLIHLPACVANVHTARRARGLPTLPLLAEWTPMLVFITSCAAWLGAPRSALLKDGYLNLFCYTMSLVFGRMTTKIILAHLTRQPFPLWTVLLAPLVGGALFANARSLGLTALDVFAKPGVEFWYLRGYFVFAAIVYGRWAHLVITSICDYLGINCLTIPRSKWEALASQTPLGGPIPNGNSPKKD